MHFVVELGHPFADVALECVDLQIAIFYEYNLANHCVLPAELVVIYWVQKEWRLVLSILCVDHESLGLASSISLLKLPFGVVIEMAIDACFDWVANDCQGVALLLGSIIVQFGDNVIFVVLERRCRVIFIVVFLILLADHLTFFFHDVAKQILHDRSLLLLRLLLFRSVGRDEQVIVWIQLLELLLRGHLL